jgi:hypothetical protein
MEKVAIGMLGYIILILKETGFPKQVEMLPGYTRIGRGVMEKVAIALWDAWLSFLFRVQSFPPS